MALVACCDRKADIVYVELRDVRSVEHDWGLIDLGDDGKPVGAEYWDASDHLPPELLGELPRPRARGRATISGKVRAGHP